MKNWKVGKTHTNTTVIISSETNNIHLHISSTFISRVDKEDNKKLSIPQHHLGSISPKAKRNRENPMKTKPKKKKSKNIRKKKIVFRENDSKKSFLRKLSRENHCYT